ncbi:MAG: hypothetical protein ACKVW3_16405 [Phycisphaerales bacterium]
MKPSSSRSNAEIAKAARDGPGIDAAMRRAVAAELEMRRKLGYPIVTLESLGQQPATNGHPEPERPPNGAGKPS